MQDANSSYAIETGKKVMIGEKYFPIKKLKEYSENPNTFSVCTCTCRYRSVCEGVSEHICVRVYVCI